MISADHSGGTCVFEGIADITGAKIFAKRVAKTIDEIKRDDPTERWLKPNCWDADPEDFVSGAIDETDCVIENVTAKGKYYSDNYFSAYKANKHSGLKDEDDLYILSYKVEDEDVPFRDDRSDEMLKSVLVGSEVCTGEGGAKIGIGGTVSNLSSVYKRMTGGSL